MSTYEHRVHRVMDYVRGNLAADVSLDALAKVAGFSSFHFHRIFKGITGETVASFTRRARLERAVYLMRGAPGRDLTSIALEVGFATPSDFSRVFRAAFGIPPSIWDRSRRLDDKPDFAVGATREERSALQARVVERAACRVVYVRVRDPWVGDSLARGYDRLVAWARGRGVAEPSTQLIGLSWDSEKATPLQKLTYDLGLTVDDSVAPTEGLGLHTFEAVKTVEVHCESLRSTALAWAFLYEQWLPGSGFEPAELPAFKRFRVLPRVIDASAWNVDCSIALRPTR